MDEDEKKTSFLLYTLAARGRKTKGGLFCEKRMVSASIIPSKGCIFNPPPQKKTAIGGGGRGERGHRRRIHSGRGGGERRYTPGDSCAA